MTKKIFRMYLKDINRDGYVYIKDFDDAHAFARMGGFKVKYDKKPISVVTKEKEVYGIGHQKQKVTRCLGVRYTQGYLVVKN